MSIQQESLEGKVITVRGPIAGEKMGITLPHEHLLWHHTPDELVFDDPILATEELMKFSKAGGQTLVELTNVGIGRDPVGLKDISLKTGVNIIMGCGYYKEQWHPSDMDEKTVEELAEEMVKDMTEGVKGTGIQAGVIGEIGIIGIVSLTANEKKVIIASAKAQLRTGVAINLHFDTGTKEERRMHVLDILEDEGVSLDRVINSHLLAGKIDEARRIQRVFSMKGAPSQFYESCRQAPWNPFEPRIESPSYHQRIAQRGSYVEYDFFGQEGLFPSISRYEQESVFIKELIESGFLERILISQDVCSKKHLTKYGGWGYGHILNNVIPMFKENGITDEDIRTIMIENPKRVFSIQFQ